jgi:hypothetical protein
VVRFGTYIIIGILCLAMAAGVFLGGPPPSASNDTAKGSGSGKAPAIAPFTTADEGRLNRQREVVDTLLKKSGGDPTTMTTVAGKIAGLQKILDGDKLAVNPNWELRCIGAVFGDALVQGVGMKWVIVNDDQGRTAALLMEGTQFLAVPAQLFTGQRGGEPPMDVQALYDTAREQLKAPASGAPKG